MSRNLPFSLLKFSPRLSDTFRVEQSINLPVFLITLLGTILWVCLPLYRSYRAKKQRYWDEKLYAYKLIAIRRYYPALHHLSFQEIESQFNLEEAWNNIGK